MLRFIHKFENLENIYLVDIQCIHIFIINHTHSMLLFLQNFIKFSPSCASACSIAIVYIVMGTGEIYIFLDFFFLIMRTPIYYTYIFDILFSTNSICLFQVMFSFIITLRNLMKDSRFISILMKVMVGNLIGILSRALCLCKNIYLVFPALRD